MLIGIVFILTLTGLGVAAEPGVQVEQQGLTEGSSAPVILGDAQFDAYVPLLEGKRVALFSNHTGIVGDETSGIGELPEGVDASLIHFGLDAEGNAITYGLHILDALIEHGVNVTAFPRSTASGGRRMRVRR